MSDNASNVMRCLGGNPFTPFPFACRDNSTGQLLYINSIPRIEKFCPHCIALINPGACLFDSPRHRLYRLGKIKDDPTVCHGCHKPLNDELHLYCPTCRKRAQRNDAWRQKEKHAKQRAR